MNTNPIIKQALTDTKAKRDEALKNAQVMLEKAFEPKVLEMLEEQAEGDRKQEEIDEMIEELENDVDMDISSEFDCGSIRKKEPKKSSFISNLIVSLSREKINSQRQMTCRFQKLAGIRTMTPAARLTIGKQIFDLQEIPPWYDVIRYKLCGCKFEIPVKCNDIPTILYNEVKT